LAEGIMSLGPLSCSTPQEWQKAGLRLGRPLRTIMWAHGDWWNGGEKFGPLRKQIVTSPAWLAAGGSTYDDCKHFGSLGRRFPEKWRRLHPSPSFYQSVRRLPDTVALPLLERAAKENWTLKRIRRDVGRIRNHYAPAGPDIADSLDTLIAEGRHFRAVLADVPWRDDVGDGGGHERGSHVKHYRDMHFDELAALPVSDILTDDGYVLLWCPAKLLKMGIALLEAWGTQYMTCLCWIKDSIGIGHYFRMRHELLLLGVCPKSTPFIEKPDSVLTAPRRGHSEKPAIHHMIATAVGDGPFLEMFARRRVEKDNWTFLGDQVENSAPAPSFPAPPIIQPHPWHDILLGDCLPILRAMPTNSADTVIGSLPFWQARQYNGLGVGREATLTEYHDATLPILQEALRVTKGTVCINLGDRRENGSQLLLPARFALAAMQANPGIRLVNDVKGFRDQLRPHSVDSKWLTVADQDWFIFAKHPDYYWDASEWNLRPPLTPVRHTTRLGEGYRRIIATTHHLTDAEKRNALAALDSAVAAVKAGYAREFRMVIRGHHASPFGGEPSNQLRAMEQDGFYVFQAERKQLRTNVISHASTARIGNRHPAIFPESVVMQFIKLLCPTEGLVIDPVVGSGTTIVAARKCGRSGLGIEIDPQYHAAALEWLHRG
jgi:site-specific DNA-methyltransferase (adenine-specific)